MELTLPSVQFRVRELAAAAALRCIRGDVDARLTRAVMYLKENRDLHIVPKYAMTLYDVMLESAVDKHCVPLAQA